MALLGAAAAEGEDAAGVTTGAEAGAAAVLAGALLLGAAALDEGLAGLMPVAPLPPGLKANIRKSAIANPACSSGASDKSARLIIAI